MSYTDYTANVSLGANRSVIFTIGYIRLSSSYNAAYSIADACNSTEVIAARNPLTRSTSCNTADIPAGCANCAVVYRILDFYT